MKVYYAHCMAIYNTPQEERDVKLLESLEYEVENPNSQIHQDKIKQIFKEGSTTSEVMNYFCDVVKACDCLAFRAVQDGGIPAGIYKEIGAMKEKLGPVFELPSGLVKRVMSINETKEYLLEAGQR